MQMHATQNCVKRQAPDQMGNVFQRVDHSGMCTAENNNRTAGSFHKKGLIIQERIRLAAFRVKTEFLSALFFRMDAGNFPCQEQARGYFSRGCDGPDVFTPVTDRFETTLGNADVLDSGFRPAIFGLKCSRMRIDRHLAPRVG